MPPVALRPRSTTELIDAAVQLLRHHYMELITTSAIFLIPAFILKLFLPDMRSGRLPAGNQLVLFGVGLAVTAVFSIVSSSAVVVIVSDSYLGREVSIGAAVQRVIGRVWSVFWTAILQFLLAAAGTVAFLIPGLFCVAWFFAATVVVVIEGKDTFAALRRSYQLASGSVARILGILFLSIVLVLLHAGRATLRAAFRPATLAAAATRSGPPPAIHSSASLTRIRRPAPRPTCGSPGTPGAPAHHREIVPDE